MKYHLPRSMSMSRHRFLFIQLCLIQRQISNFYWSSSKDWEEDLNSTSKIYCITQNNKAWSCLVRSPTTLSLLYAMYCKWVQLCGGFSSFYQVHIYDKMTPRRWIHFLAQILISNLENSDPRGQIVRHSVVLCGYCSRSYQLDYC